MLTYLKGLWAKLEKVFFYDEFRDVAKMHEKFGILTFDSPGHVTKRLLRERIEAMREELNEFEEAVEAQDLELQADALVDLAVFTKGTAVMLGLPWEELWCDVDRANTEKERGVGKRGHAVDLIKPPGWVGPKTHEILVAHGYDRDDWCYFDADQVNENLCRDYGRPNS